MAEKFRKNWSTKRSYWEQGYIFFVSQKYKELPGYYQEWIEEYCQEVGGEHWKALFDYVTTDISTTAVCIKYYISESTLKKLVKRYYDEFPKEL